MANPYLVIGGIAVGIATAGFGILQVPGWVNAAQDAAAVNDLAQASIVEATAASVGLGYLSGAEFAENAPGLGVTFTGSNGVTLCVTRSAAGDAFAAVAISPSGSFFARTHESSKAVGAETAQAALDAIGGLPAGVPMPVDGDDCADDTATPGDGSGGGGGGGETPGNPGTPLGAVTQMGVINKVIHTSHGTYAVGHGQKLTRSGSDGLPHEVNATGPLANMTLNGYALARDAQENLYTAGTFTEGGVEKVLIVKVAPDHSSTIVAELPAKSVVTIGSDAAGGNIHYWLWPEIDGGAPGEQGTMWKITSSGPTPVAMSTAPMWGNLDSIVSDTAGNVYYGWEAGPSATWKLTPDGTSTRIQAANGGFNHSFTNRVVVAPDGTMYGEAESYSPVGEDVIMRVGTDGSVTPFFDFKTKLTGDMGALTPLLTDVDASGNIYGVLRDANNGQAVTSHVFKLTPSGQLTMLMENAGSKHTLR